MDRQGPVRVAVVWTDNRRSKDEKFVEIEYEVAVALANLTDGAARSTVLKVTRKEPSNVVADDGYLPKSLNDSAMTLPPMLALPKRCQDAKEPKEKNSSW